MSRFAIKERQTLGIILAGQRTNRNNKTLFQRKGERQKRAVRRFSRFLLNYQLMRIWRNSRQYSLNTKKMVSSINGYKDVIFDRMIKKNKFSL